MKTIDFNHSGVAIGEMGLGIVKYGSGIADALAFGLMDRFIEAGGNLIDTSNMYAHWLTGGPEEGGGESESCLGRWMRVRGNRDKVFISTKVGQAYPGVPAGLSAATIIAECEKSLKRLGTDGRYPGSLRSPGERRQGALYRRQQPARLAYCCQ